MRKLGFIAVLTGLMAVTTGLLADQIQALDGYGPYQTGQGGEFTFGIIDSGPPDLNNAWSYYALAARDQWATGKPNFQTFCVEGNEYVYPSPTIYDVTLGQQTVFTGTTLSRGAALLYYDFARGLFGSGGLPTYQYTGAVAQRKASADPLQRAIWWLMGQEGQTYNPGNAYMKFAADTFGSPENALLANDTLANPISVGVLSLWVPGYAGASGYQRQDQLLLTGDTGYSVPDGGLTLALLGFALAGLAVVRRSVPK